MRKIKDEECCTLKDFLKNSKDDIKKEYDEFELWLRNNNLVSSYFDGVMATPIAEENEYLKNYKTLRYDLEKLTSKLDIDVYVTSKGADYILKHFKEQED